MKIETKIFDKKGETKTNKSKKGDPTSFCFEFPCQPNIGDKVLIQDADAKGEYVVSEHSIYEIVNSKAFRFLVLQEKEFCKETRIAIDN